MTTARIRRWWGLMALAGAAALAGCDAGRTRTGAAEATPAGPAAARSGTRRMADTLAALATLARAYPGTNTFLNAERAGAIATLLPLQSGAEALNSRHRLADELLRAGRTREAIRELEALLRDGGVTGDAIEPRHKPLLELLAIAWLRLGEQENCLEGPAANRCILPLDGDARHRREEGARGAIARYSQLLRSFPDDHGSRYLLNVAWLALGGYPDSVPPRWRVPGLAPSPGERFPRFRNVAADVGLGIEGVAGALAIEDFDGDGRLDVFTTEWGIGDPPHLLLADGAGGFLDRTDEAGLRDLVGGLNAVHADYDNDGDVDLFVLRGAWLGEAGRLPNSLLRNRGDGTFEDVTFAAGLSSFHPTQAGAWADFNLDGRLDLFVGNENSGTGSHPSELWLSNADGTFTDVAARVGIVLDDFVKGATWGDVNDDGLPDLFVSVLHAPNRLYVNRGGTSVADWRFEECAADAGVTRPLASFPTWFWDADQDGRDDLLVLSYDLRRPLQQVVARELLGLPLVTDRDGAGSEVEGSRLYRNRGDGTFEDVSARAGLAGRAIFAMGSNFGDLDNDGWLDFHVGTGNPDLRSIIPNRMFRSVGGRRFEEVTLPGGFAHLQKGHGTAFADLDADGDEDVFMVVGGAYQGDRAGTALYENPGTPGQAWIKLHLEGRTANRSAIGARVAIDVEDARGHMRTIHRTVGTGGSFGSGPLTLHVGLGDAARVREVRVRWPDRGRTRTTYAALAPARTWQLTQGEPARALERSPVQFRRGAPTPHAHGEAAGAAR